MDHTPCRPQPDDDGRLDVRAARLYDVADKALAKYEFLGERTYEAKADEAERVGQHLAEHLCRAAVGADGHIDAGFLEILVTSRSNLDESGSLTSANALGLPGDADGAAADAHLHKVSAR